MSMFDLKKQGINVYVYTYMYAYITNIMEYYVYYNILCILDIYI